MSIDEWQGSKLAWGLMRMRQRKRMEHLPGPRHRRNRHPPCDPLERLRLAEAESGGLTILEEFEGDNAHAATLGLPGVIATMDGSSRSGM
jgi:hypothetical protein